MRSGNKRSGYKRRKEVIRERIGYNREEKRLEDKIRCNKRREAVIREKRSGYKIR